jgi:quercetin dioxygenase-like cupin family protein
MNLWFFKKIIFIGAHKMSDHEGILYTIENGKNGEASITGQKPLAYQKLDVNGWKVKQISKSGLEINVYQVAPNTIYQAHKAPVDLICVVSEGFGELFLTDEAGLEISHIKCKKGDAYFQGANTRHGFRNGTEETVLIYIENLKNRL